MYMVAQHERILVVENDPETCDIIVRQTLQPMGYNVEVVGAVNQAIQAAARFLPDVILTNLNLPGLSGKDLLVALSSQGLEIPIIVIAEKGMEGDVIQAFRLGATAFLVFPIREAEVVSTVERTLKQVRERKEKEQLTSQLNQTNRELQRRVRELTTIFAIGKAVTSITNQATLLDKIVEGAVSVTEADSGWLLLRENKGKRFLLSACKNMPKSIADKIGQPLDDGINSLVALSGESLMIHGEPLKRFKLAYLGGSALIVPVKTQKEVIGLLVVIRKASSSFGPSNQALLEAVADYASISLLNAQLFNFLEERARSLQLNVEKASASDHIDDEILKNVSRVLHALVNDTLQQVNLTLEAQKETFDEKALSPIQMVKENLDHLQDLVELVTNLQRTDYSKQDDLIDLNDLARQSIARFQPVADCSEISLSMDLASSLASMHGNASHIEYVIESLLSNAIKYSHKGGKVNIAVRILKENAKPWSLLQVQDNGIGIDSNSVKKVFNPSFPKISLKELHFGGFGIGLSLSKEIVLAYGGKIWAESKLGKGSTFNIAFPSMNTK
jgi:signal transduction histidine kinase/DNA-binding response OmpR family regulator